MVTRIGPKRPHRLFIKEWLDYRGLSDERVANRLGVARQTVFRWRTQPHRLDPDKQVLLASALDCEPEDLWHLPDKPSLDSMVKDADPKLRQTAADIVRRLVQKG